VFTGVLNPSYIIRRSSAHFNTKQNKSITSSGKIDYKNKPYYDGYVLNPTKNDDRRVLCSYTRSHISFVHDFDSITSLFSDHTPNISVTENDKITLSKS
jgi:hypothetical protein